jgi:hypothetical protein
MSKNTLLIGTLPDRDSIIAIIPDDELDISEFNGMEACSPDDKSSEKVQNFYRKFLQLSDDFFREDEQPYTGEYAKYREIKFPATFDKIVHIYWSY